MSEMVFSFPGGARVDAQFGSFVVQTDQSPTGGGNGSAPTPFATFLASLGTCAGIYVLGFCRQRNLPAAGIRLVQRVVNQPGSRRIGKIELEIQVPPEFPEKYRDALVRSANQCAVKKLIESPPEFDISTVVV